MTEIDKTDNIINLIYCLDDNFAKVCATSIVSVIQNKGSERISFYIIDNGIDGENKKHIASLIDKCDGCNVTFLPFPDLSKHFENLHFDENHLSISTFGRLFISELLESSVEKAIYIDCDTIVKTSLKNLYEYDLSGKTLGGVDDCKSGIYRKVLGTNKNAPYINAGVLLIDLKLWNENKCEERLVQYINKHNGKIHFEDQGAINAVLYNEIKLLPLKFNVMTHLYDLSYDELMYFRNPVIPYNKEEVESAKNEANIIHFTSSFLTCSRVWYKDSNHTMKDLYDTYYYKTGYNTDVLSDYSNNKKIKSILLNKLGRKISIKVARFFHEIYEPYKNYVWMRIGIL